MAQSCIVGYVKCEKCGETAKLGKITNSDNVNWIIMCPKCKIPQTVLHLSDYLLTHTVSKIYK